MSEAIGSSFEDFLKREGIAEEVHEGAVKLTIAYQIAEEMKARNISKTDMARELGTSRAAIDRLLNPDSDAVTLATLKRAASFLGKKLRLELRDAVTVE